MNKTYWKITYIENGKEVEAGGFNKKDTLREYLNLICGTQDISSLKFWKNNIDYTETLNKFIYR